MPALHEIGKILKEEREKRGLSLKEVHERTKISVEILKNIEEDPEYIKKEPYAKFLIKQLIKEYGLDIKIEEPKKEIVVEIPEKKPKKINKTAAAVIVSLFHIFRIAFVVGVFTSLIYLSQTTTASNVKDRLIELITLPSKHFSNQPIEIVSFKEVHKDGKKIDDIVLRANSDIWLTAYIDGKETIIKLKKGETKKITFCNKIRFETIGNANKLEVVFNNKKVKLSHKKVLHNVFVDSEGIFINGYNIVE